jgi:hypothetical protein
LVAAASALPEYVFYVFHHTGRPANPALDRLALAAKKRVKESPLQDEVVRERRVANIIECSAEPKPFT